MWLSALYVIVSYTLNLALYLLPGFAVALVCSARRKIEPLYLVIIVVITGALLGYASFWCFFAHKQSGKLFTFAVYATALVFTVWVLLRSTHSAAATG